MILNMTQEITNGGFMIYSVFLHIMLLLHCPMIRWECNKSSFMGKLGSNQRLGWSRGNDGLYIKYFHPIV